MDIRHISPHASPQEVKDTVRRKLNATGLGRSVIAAKLGYGSGTDFYHMAFRNRTRYFGRQMAERLSAAFGFSEPFLTGGEGTIDGKAAEEEPRMGPERVIHDIFEDIARRGDTAVEAASKLGYTSTTSLNAVRRKGTYLSPTAAERFVEAYGYSYDYLTTGRGTLTPAEDEGEERQQSTLTVLTELIVNQEKEIGRLRLANEAYRRELERTREGPSPAPGGQEE